MGTMYIVHEGNPKLHYYNNTLDYYTFNIVITFANYIYSQSKCFCEQNK
jgi:hypothetical protein